MVNAARFMWKTGLMDECQIGVATAAPSSGPDPVGAVTYNYATAIDCWVRPSTSGERLGLGQAAMGETVIIVPSGTSVKNSDRVKVTKIWGSAVPRETVYAVQGDPIQKPGCLELTCRRVTGGSAL